MPPPETVPEPEPSLVPVTENVCTLKFAVTIPFADAVIEQALPDHDEPSPDHPEV